MSFDGLKDRLPDYGKDIKLNLSNVVGSTALNPKQLWGAMLASAIAARNAAVIAAVRQEAARHLDAKAQYAAKAAAAIMAMNNVYYRSIHMMGDEEYRRMPARLRMQAIGNSGVDKIDFELWSLAVSAINGCGACLEAHAREVAEKDASREAVQDTLRIAAVMHAFAVVLEAQVALPTAPAAAA